MPVKPNMTIAWSFNGTNVKPSDTKINQGWIAEKPPFQSMNWIQNRADVFIQHVNEEGIPRWDSISNYIVNSIVKGSDGELYRSLTVNSNIDPVSGTPGNWLLISFLLDRKILDSDGEVILSLLDNTNGKNHIEMENSGVGTGPKITPVGPDTDINLNLNTKASGRLLVNGVQIGYRGAMAHKSSTQSVPDDSANFTTVLFEATQHDTDSIHNGAVNSSRLTVPANVSKVKLNFQIALDSIGDTGRVFSKTVMNGSGFIGDILIAAEPPLASTKTYLSGETSVVNVSAGDYFELEILQNSGSAQDIDNGATWFSMQIIKWDEL